MATTTRSANPFIPRINFPIYRCITNNDLALLGPNANHIEWLRRRAYGYSRSAFHTAQGRADIMSMGELVNDISYTESWHVDQVKRLNLILGEMQRGVSNARMETNDCERNIARLERGLEPHGHDESRYIAIFKVKVWNGLIKQQQRDEDEIAELRRQMKMVQEKLLERDRNCEEHRKEIWNDIEHRWTAFVENLRPPIMSQVSTHSEMELD